MSSLRKFIIIIAVHSSHVLYLDCSISARLLKLTKPFQTFSGKKTYSAPDRAAEYCDERVCLSVCLCVCLCVCVCVCLSAIISWELHVRSSAIFLACYLWRGSVRFWQRSDTLCTSGFIDDVMFAHKPRLLDVAAQLKRSAHPAWAWL